MLKVSNADRVHVSAIVSALNRVEQDYPLYIKHKVTIEEIEAEAELWRLLSGEDGLPLAFIKILSVDWLSRVTKYALVKITPQHVGRDALTACVSYLFNTYNCNKITTDIIYDRNEIIKDHIYLGSNIEVRKRQHAFLSGKYHHVVEMALFNNEFKNE